MRVYMQFIFALLLLFAQQQALAHPLIHLHDPVPGRTGGDAGKHGSSPMACEFHAAHSQVLGGVDAPVPVCNFHRGASGPVDGFCFTPVFASRITATSRGPPLLR